MFYKRSFLRHVYLIFITVALAVLMSLFAERSSARTSTFASPLPFFADCPAFCFESFDSLTAPAIPAGWTAAIPTALPGDVPWMAVNTTFDSAPNSAFANDPNHLTDNWLTSGTIAIISSATMTFTRRNNLEDGFDGMVLEISIAGGPFVDIIAAGASITNGGYDKAISTGFGSSIGGRMAWTGDTGGFVTTRVNLPFSLVGRLVRFRWRVATDNSVAGVGAFIDNITLTGWAQPVTNDNYTNAQPLLGASGMINGHNVGATKETNEANHGGVSGGASVWYRWQAPASGRFVFTTYRSNFSTLIAVYTGNTLPASPVPSTNGEESFACFSSVPNRFVAFNATGGTVYHIAIDGNSVGTIVLRWGRSATISGRVTTASGGGPGGAETSRLEQDVCRNGFGGVNFTDVPTGGSYNVIVQKPGWFYTRWGTTASISPLTGDVSEYNFFLVSPTADISGRVTITDVTLNGLTVTCAPTGPGLIPPRTVTVSEVPPAPGDPLTGAFRCASLPINAQYVVTPSKPGFIFSPPSVTVDFLGSLGVGIQAPFAGSSAPSRTITGRVTLTNSLTGVSGVAVGLGGSQTESKVTDTNGNYSFTVLHGGNYTVTPSHSNFTFTPPNRSFNNLTAPETTANFTATSLLQLILDESGQVAALDSMLLMRDPFPVINSANRLNRGVDRNTRVAIFVSNFQLGPTEPPSSVVINLVGSNNQTYDIPAEAVRPVSNLGFTQVIFRLPDTLTPGVCTLAVKGHGLTSNLGTMRIRN